MALKSCSKRTLDGHWAQCGYADSYLTETININSVSWSRDTSDCRRAVLTYGLNTVAHYTQINWGCPTCTYRVGAQLSSNINSNSGYANYQRGNKVCNNNPGKSYSYTGNLTCKIDSGSGDPVVYFKADNGAGFDYSYSSNCTWQRSANYKVTGPTGLSCTWPGAVTGNIAASISAWSANANIGGTPTNYPNHLNWNWKTDLLNKDGNVIRTKTFNSGENKTPTLTVDTSTIGKNAKCKIRVTISNNMNLQANTTSGWYYTDVPEPKVKITSCVYDPATKLCKLTFTYSKEKDDGGLGERLRYDIYDVRTGTSFSGKDNVTISTVTDGRAMSGSITVTGIPTATNVGVRLELTTSADNYASVKKSATATVYSPVADAAFINIVWDDVRRQCTITATAPGAKQTRVSAGYSPNNYNIATKVTAGETGTVVVKDLNHGSGQVLYLEAMPEAIDSHKYKDQVAKLSIPIPNPILGIRVPRCGSGQDKEYIVDIVEKKKNCSVTPRWQNGDRVVKKTKCSGT